MIRLLASDIDGTLLNSKRQVSTRNKEALQRAHESGIVVCLASGRLVPTLRPIAEEANVVGPIITCNGAYVESQEGQVLLSATLGADAQKLVLDYAKEHRVTTNIYQPYKVLTTFESPWIDMYRKRVSLLPEVLDWSEMQDHVPTKMIFIDDPERNLKHGDFFRPLQERYGFHMTVSEPEYLEFLPAGINKQTALMAVSDHLGLDQSEVAAIGDYFNDLEMVTWAGLGAAMGSGSEVLKAQADVVVPSNDEDGLAVFIEQILELNANG